MPSTRGDHLPHTITLKNGTTVLIRRAEPEDLQMIFHLFRSLSDDTMFRRFLRSQRNLTREDAQEMLRLNEGNVTSLIAVLKMNHEERAIGEARYVANPTGRLAEAAVVVADEWQNCGLGTALFSDLIAEAGRQGLTKIFAYFDLQNKSIIHLGEKFGFKLAKERKPDYAMMKAELAL